MSERYDFLGVGGLAVDWLMSVDRLPIADDKYPARLVGKLPGGFIANATCGAGRLGLRSAYIGWTGDDADADLLVDDFGAHGVDPAGLVRVPGELTPFTVVITDLGVLRPDPETKELTLAALHPGATVEQAREATAWQLRVTEDPGTTDPPTDKELAVLRDLRARTEAARF